MALRAQVFLPVAFLGASYQVALKQVIYQQPQTLTCHRTGETPVPPIITFLMATWPQAGEHLSFAYPGGLRIPRTLPLTLRPARNRELRTFVRIEIGRGVPLPQGRVSVSQGGRERADVGIAIPGALVGAPEAPPSAHPLSSATATNSHNPLALQTRFIMPHSSAAQAGSCRRTGPEGASESDPSRRQLNHKH